MYFDFEDYRPDLARIERAISWREGVLLSIIVHLLAVIAALVLPRFLPESARKPVGLFALAQQARQNPRFVFVAPRLDTPAAKPPDRADNSDINRRARAPMRAPDPANLLPLSRGNSPERVEEDAARAARGEGPQPPAPQSQQAQASRDPQSQPPRLPDLPSGLTPPRPASSGRPTISGGALGDALNNLQRYIKPNQFENPQGGAGEPGASIQFDTKGVEFGPWIRRFVQLIRRNWNIPQAAMFLKGHVVITFNFHKDGTITDLAVVGPCPVEAFNTAAFGALVSSSGVLPLPPEYPAEKAFFTVTFYYNEQPPQ